MLTRLHACVVHRQVPCLRVLSRAYSSPSDETKKPKHKKKEWNPDSLILRREEEPVEVEKEKRASKGHWAPTRTLPHNIIDQIRMLHQEDPKTYDIHFLMARYKAPFEAIKRILHSKFVPSEEKIAKREEQRREKRAVQYEEYEEETERENNKSEPQKKEAIDTGRLMQLIQHKSKDKIGSKKLRQEKEKRDNDKKEQGKHTNTKVFKNNNNNNNNNNINNKWNNNINKKWSNNNKEDRREGQKQQTQQNFQQSKQNTPNFERNQTTIKHNNNKYNNNKQHNYKPKETKSETNEPPTQQTIKEETTITPIQTKQKEEKKQQEGGEEKEEKKERKEKKEKKEKRGKMTINALLATAVVATQTEVVIGPDSDVYDDVDAIMRASEHSTKRAPKQVEEEEEEKDEEEEGEKKKKKKKMVICKGCNGECMVVTVGIRQGGLVQISLQICQDCKGQGRVKLKNNNE